MTRLKTGETGDQITILLALSSAHWSLVVTQLNVIGEMHWKMDCMILEGEGGREGSRSLILITLISPGPGQLTKVFVRKCSDLSSNSSPMKEMVSVIAITIFGSKKLVKSSLFFF